MQIVAHVAGQLAVGFEDGGRGGGQVEFLQCSQQGLATRVFHQMAPRFDLRFASGLIAHEDLGELLQVFRRVPEIEDEVHVLRDPGQGLRDAIFEPRAAIGQGHHLVRAIDAHGFALAAQLLSDGGEIDESRHVSGSAIRVLGGFGIVAKHDAHERHAALGGLGVRALLPHRDRVETHVRGGLPVRIGRPGPDLIGTEGVPLRAAASQLITDPLGDPLHT